MKIFKLIKEFQKTNPNYDFGTMHPFVFSMPEEALKKGPSELEYHDDNIVIASPFETWSIEMEGGSYLTVSNGERINVKIESIYVKEISINSFEFLIGCHITDANKNTTFIAHKIKKHDDTYNSVFSMVANYVRRINSEDVGKINREGKVKLRSKGKNIKYKPNNVIYVSSKKQARKNSGKTSSGQRVNWISRWGVRGHFRRLQNPESIGKDRSGNRVVHGFTWISEHHKGEGELTSKTYKVAG
jgi:hypothetical protein